MLGYLNEISFLGYDFQSYPNSQKISLNILTYPYISYHIPKYPKISSGANSQMKILISRKFCVKMSGTISRPSGDSTPPKLRFLKKP
jgi:hypothetical protein